MARVQPCVSYWRREATSDQIALVTPNEHALYLPAWHDGQGLPLLVDLVGFTVSGLSLTNWMPPATWLRPARSRAPVPSIRQGRTEVFDSAERRLVDPLQRGQPSL
jgi:hypothetical protein